MKIGKMVLNIGVGKNPSMMEKAVSFLEELTGMKPTKCITQKRIAGWNIRPGLPIGCKVTIRGKKAEELLKRFLQAKDNVLNEKNFDELGNVSFGIHEYINVPGIEYNPKIGIIGFQVCLNIERPGFRIKRRRYQKKKIAHKHSISKEESIKFMEDKFGVKVEEKE